MSKVAEAMEVYEIFLEDLSLEEAKAMLEKEGFFVINEETSDPDDLASMTKLTVEGLVDPMDVFDELLRASDPKTGETLYYIW